MAQNTKQKRFITSILPMISYAIDHGIETSDILEGTFLNEKHLLNANSSIDMQQEFQIIRNLSLKCPHPELPWDLGEYYHPNTHGVIGNLLLRAATLGEALKLIPQYSLLSHSYFKIHIEKTPKFIRGHMIENNLPQDMISFFIERDFSALLTGLETIFPGKTKKIIRCISFAHAPRTDISKYLCRFIENLDFNQPSSFLEIYKSALLLPMPGRNKQAFELLFQQCQAEYYLRGGRRMDMADKIFLFLQAEKGRIKFTEIADHLHMNERSLRIQLNKEGTNFRKIRQDYLLHQAITCLKDPSMSISDIAEKIGYSETCAFTRAFQRQTGMSPIRYRKVHCR